MIWFEKSDLLQVFYFFSLCKLPGKKENRQKKTFKGIVYLFDSLRILFSYNLSAIKMWVFLFSFQAYQLSVFVTFVKASYMFNKANYLVNYTHEGILITLITVQVLFQKQIRISTIIWIELSLMVHCWHQLSIVSWNTMVELCLNYVLSGAVEGIFLLVIFLPYELMRTCH